MKAFIPHSCCSSCSSTPSGASRDIVPRQKSDQRTSVAAAASRSASALAAVSSSSTAPLSTAAPPRSHTSAARASPTRPLEMSQRGERGIASMPSARHPPGSSCARIEMRHPLGTAERAQLSQNATVMPTVIASWYSATQAPRRRGAATSDW